MLDREMLTAMSEIMDQKLEVLEVRLEQTLEEKLEKKLDPICDRLDSLESDMKYVRVVQLENNVIPRLNTIESYYLDTSKRYLDKTEQDSMSEDIAVLKSVVSNHSHRLNKIPV